MELNAPTMHKDFNAVLFTFENLHFPLSSYKITSFSGWISRDRISQLEQTKSDPFYKMSVFGNPPVATTTKSGFFSITSSD